VRFEVVKDLLKNTHLLQPQQLSLITALSSIFDRDFAEKLAKKEISNEDLQKHEVGIINKILTLWKENAKFDQEIMPKYISNHRLCEWKAKNNQHKSKFLIGYFEAYVATKNHEDKVHWEMDINPVPFISAYLHLMKDGKIGLLKGCKIPLK